MKALRFDGNLTLVDTPVPEPGVKEALIRVSCAGICNTDLEIFRGYMDFSGIPGHEFVGVVEACEDPRWVGKRVVGEINLGCGSCPRCRRGLARHCGNRRVLGILGKDGAFAEYLTLPVANLHEVPTQLSDEAALFTEPLAAAFEILEQVHIRPDDAVLIVGDGKLAQLIARVVRTTGCRLTCLGRHPEKLEHMRRLDGIETRTDEPAGRYDVVVECSGKPEGLSIALSALVPRGTLVLKSTFHGKVTLESAPIVIDEFTIVGSRCGPFPPALRALSSSISVESLVSARFPLEEGLRAVEAASRPDALKVVLQCRT